VAYASQMASNINTGFLNRALPDGAGQRRYQVYVPCDYTPQRRWPVILFLHGAGEGGRDALLPTEYQLGSAIRRNADRFPAIVVFPQVQRQVGWADADVRFALEALSATEREFITDPDRVYLTGVSSGGKATWYTLYRYPERFAAALIVCGRAGPLTSNGTVVRESDPIVPQVDGHPITQLARAVRAIPVWVFHGDVDPIFPIEDARAVTAELQRQGAVVRYTELAGFGHDVWDIAYYSAEVADWLLMQSRSN